MHGKRWWKATSGVHRWDIESFFDEIPHNLILKLIRRKIQDERLVTMVGAGAEGGS